MISQEIVQQEVVTWDNFGDLLMLEYAQHLRVFDLVAMMNNEIARLHGGQIDTSSIPWDAMPANLQLEAAGSKQVLEDPSSSILEKSEELEALNGLIRGRHLAPLNWLLHESPDGQPIVGPGSPKVYFRKLWNQGQIMQVNEKGEAMGKLVNEVEGRIVHAEIYDTEFSGNSGFLKLATSSLWRRKQYCVDGLIDRNSYRANFKMKFLT